jgi:hypothetical protein
MAWYQHRCLVKWLLWSRLTCGTLFSRKATSNTFTSELPPSSNIRICARVFSRDEEVTPTIWLSQARWWSRVMFIPRRTRPLVCSLSGRYGDTYDFNRVRGLEDELFITTATERELSMSVECYIANRGIGDTRVELLRRWNASTLTRTHSADSHFNSR